MNERDQYVGSKASLFRSDRSLLYLNVFVRDAHNAMERKIRHECEVHKVPGPFHKMATQLGASFLGSPERVAEMLAQELPDKITQKMAAHGFLVVVDVCCLDGPYLVLALQVISIDIPATIQAMARNWHDDEDGSLEQEAIIRGVTASRLIYIWLALVRFFGHWMHQRIEKLWLPYLLLRCGILQRMLDQNTRRKFAYKGLLAETKVLSEQEEARYHFQALYQVRSQKANLQRNSNDLAACIANPLAVSNTSEAKLKMDVFCSLEQDDTTSSSSCFNADESTFRTPVPVPREKIQ